MELVITIKGFLFSESDLEYISWEISSHMMTLISLNLSLDDDQTCVEGLNCSHNIGYVGMTNNTGDWGADTQVCSGVVCSLLQINFRDKRFLI
jgi:hypothetical protein